MSSITASVELGWGPKIAQLEGKMTTIPGLCRRRWSRMRRMESMFMARPRGRLASEAPDMRPWRR